MKVSPAPRNAAPDRAGRVATRSTYLVFIASGFAFATWASRIPAVRDHLTLSAGHLGLVLLSIAAGSVVSLPIAGWVIHHAGTRRTLTAMAALLSLALVIVGIGYLTGVRTVVGGLFLLGFGNGAWDVAMNVQGAAVERRIGRAILPRFHAGYSLGTVVGALVGAAMEAAHVPVTAHFIGVAVLTVGVVILAVRGFLPDSEGIDEAPPDVGAVDVGAADVGAVDVVAVDPAVRTPGVFGRWREPRTLLIGVFVLAFAFAEGTGNDWIGIALIDGYRVPAVVGTLGFALFLAAMTSGRWMGPLVFDRWGRVVVVRTLAVVAVTGLMLFVFGQVTGVAFAGALLWGVGTSLGFPVGMSAAADEPSAAPARVSVVASIGYCAFLGGPPLIGLLAAHFDILHAFVAVAALLAVAALVAGALRPPGPPPGPQAGRTRRAATAPGRSTA